MSGESFWEKGSEKTLFSKRVFSEDLLSFFKEDLCERCGACLRECPALMLSETEAKAEIRRLIRGEPGRHIPGACCSCFLCDDLCPNGANPHSLILSNWDERIRRKGIPFTTAFGAPLEPEPNLWSVARKKHSARERRSVREWERNFASLFGGSEFCVEEKRDFMLMGCNQWLNPFVTHTAILADLEIAGSREFCCGEPYYRAGMLDRAGGIFRRNLSLFSTCRADRIVMFCPSCYNMMKNVYPKLLNESVNIGLISFPEWLKERIEKGKLRFINKLNIDVWMQRNCHASLLGEIFHDTVVEVLSATGVRVVEGEPPGHWCCGLGPAASRQNPLDMIAHLARHLRGLPERNVVCYCNGCLMTMAAVENVRPLGFRFYHLLDLVRMAAGEDRPRSHAARALNIFATAAISAPINIIKKQSAKYP